jgi:hypothetical protein
MYHSLCTAQQHVIGLNVVLQSVAMPMSRGQFLGVDVSIWQKSMTQKSLLWPMSSNFFVVAK